MTAPAGADDAYPVAITDRPLVLPCGTTELELSEEFRTYVRSTTDAMGNVTRERIGFADDITTDIAVRHAYRNVEVSGGLGVRARFAVAIDTFAIPSRVSLGAAFSIVQKDGRYNHSQFISASHRLIVQPGRFSIVGGALVSITEALGIIDSMTVEGAIVSADVGADAFVQLGWRFALGTGVGFGAPLWQSKGFLAQPSLAVAAYLYLGLRKWDFYVGGNLFDVTRSDPGTFFTFGFKKRWGL